MAAQDQDDPFGDNMPPPEAYSEDAGQLAFDEYGFPILVGGSRDEPHSDAAYQARETERARERDELYGRLNPRQAEAVNAPGHSLLVLAGAGSGKTSVLTARIAKLVSDGTAPARNILAVTFTNKAAQEMRLRLGKLLDKRSVQDLWMGTFHSLCNKLLRENYEAANLPKAFAILDTDSQESLCRGILKDFGLTKASVKEAAKARIVNAQSDLLAMADPLAAAGGLAADDVEDDGEANEFVTPICETGPKRYSLRTSRPEFVTVPVFHPFLQWGLLAPPTKFRLPTGSIRQQKRGTACSLIPPRFDRHAATPWLQDHPATPVLRLLCHESIAASLLWTIPPRCRSG